LVAYPDIRERVPREEAGKEFEDMRGRKNYLQSTSASATYRIWHLGATVVIVKGEEVRRSVVAAIYFFGSFYARDFTEKGNVDLVQFCKLEVPNICYTLAGGAARVEARLSFPWILDRSPAHRRDGVPTYNYETPSERQGIVVEEDGWRWRSRLSVRLYIGVTR
jgi:hypothetical protein